MDRQRTAAWREIAMIPLRLRKHLTSALLLAICLSATVSVAQDDLITASGAGDLSTVKALIAQRLMWTPRGETASRR
jgi:hypothetical protein